jgi:hypothetical protein
MVTYEEVEKSIKEGNSATRPAWPDCKKIRGWHAGDEDYFMAPIFNTEGIIMQVCDQPCDCKVGIWVKNKEDVEATDWVIIIE